MPVLLYKNQDRMVKGLNANVINRLAEITNIVGVKESSSNVVPELVVYIQGALESQFKLAHLDALGVKN